MRNWPQCALAAKSAVSTSLVLVRKRDEETSTPWSVQASYNTNQCMNGNCKNMAFLWISTLHIIWCLIAVAIPHLIVKFASQGIEEAQSFSNCATQFNSLRLRDAARTSHAVDRNEQLST